MILNCAILIAGLRFAVLQTVGHRRFQLLIIFHVTMKFTQSLQFNSVPEWTSHYINYANLKKLIYHMEQKQVLDSENQELLDRNEQNFQSAVEFELERIDSFYKEQEQRLYATVNTIEQGMNQPNEELLRLCTNTYIQLCELRSYVQLNYMGFGKILKKHDKIMRQGLKREFMGKVKNTRVFKDQTRNLLQSMIEKVENMHAVLAGEDDLAKNRRKLKELLKEQVKFERNTVWRDMIQLERKVAAVKPEQPQLKNKLWIIAACMLVFGLILRMDWLPREEQNCLAMVIFMSLLWATEAGRLSILLTAGNSVICNIDAGAFAGGCIENTKGQQNRRATRNASSI